MSKNILLDVNIIRLISIACVVMMHVFAIYAGGWSPPKDIESVSAYYYIPKFLVGIRMPSITMIAGYVFAYQILTLKREYSICSVAKSKFKRLVIPCIFFGILYTIIVEQPDSYFTSKVIKDVISGVGHLWFLPMLFLCFITQTSIHNKIFEPAKNKYKVHILLLILSLMLVYIPMPSIRLFGLKAFAQYFLYFNLGYLIYYYREHIKSRINLKSIITLLILYIIIFFCYIWIKNHYIISLDHVSFIDKSIKELISRSYLVAISIVGSMLLYTAINRYLSHKNGQINHDITTMCSLCYGVYIYHQFIIQILYYHTSLPQILGSYYLPWVTLIITLAGSIYLTKFTLKTRFGYYLIG